jgi:hypothetical protein
MRRPQQLSPPCTLSHPPTGQAVYPQYSTRPSAANDAAGLAANDDPLAAS